MPVISQPGNRRALFSHRSNRVIAVARAALAAMFALWVWIAPDQPAWPSPIGYGLLSAYLGFSVFLLRAAWSDWWLDFTLSRPAFLLDCAAFLSAILFTQNAEGEFFSPYFGFFAFLMLAAVLRWSWLVALAAAVALCLGFILITWLLDLGGLAVEYQKLIRRASYMAAVSLMVVWLAVRRGGVVVDVADLPDAGSAELAPGNALHWAMASASASGGALVWQSDEEPWAVLHSAGILGNGHELLPPDDERLLAPLPPALFDLTRQRALEWRESGQLRASGAVRLPAWATRFRLSEGLCLPIRGAEGDGALVLVGIPGLSQDDLALGQAIAAETARMLDRAKALQDARAAAAARIRTDLARDLHDSVAQSLAGTGFRLAALRKQVAGGEVPLAAIDALAANLRDEQLQLRQMIDSLRQADAPRSQVDLVAALAGMLPGLGEQWGISARLEAGSGPFPMAAARQFHCLQITREAVANAVRHGQANVVTVRLSETGGKPVLEIADNGLGFPAGQVLQPRSIAERAAAMQAQLEVRSNPGDTVVTVTLPAGDRL